MSRVVDDRVRLGTHRGPGGRRRAVSGRARGPVSHRSARVQALQQLRGARSGRRARPRRAAPCPTGGPFRWEPRPFQRRFGGPILPPAPPAGLPGRRTSAGSGRDRRELPAPGGPDRRPGGKQSHGGGHCHGRPRGVKPYPCQVADQPGSHAPAPPRRQGAARSLAGVTHNTTPAPKTPYRAIMAVPASAASARNAGQGPPWSACVARCRLPACSDHQRGHAGKPSTTPAAPAAPQRRRPPFAGPVRARCQVGGHDPA